MAQVTPEQALETLRECVREIDDLYKNDPSGAYLAISGDEALSVLAHELERLEYARMRAHSDRDGFKSLMQEAREERDAAVAERDALRDGVKGWQSIAQAHKDEARLLREALERIAAEADEWTGSLWVKDRARAALRGHDPAPAVGGEADLLNRLEISGELRKQAEAQLAELETAARWVCLTGHLISDADVGVYRHAFDALVDALPKRAGHDPALTAGEPAGGASFARADVAGGTGHSPSCPSPAASAGRGQRQPEEPE